jgi:PAS domain S-box-containing protein
LNASAIHLGSAALRYGLDQFPLPAWVARGGSIRYANRALAERLGQPNSAELTGASVADYLELRVPSDIEPESLLAGFAPAKGVRATLRAAAGPVAVELASAVVSLDGEVMSLSVFHDVDATRRTEQAYRDLNHRFSRLVSGNLIGLMEFDAERILSANDAFLKLVGRTREELERGELDWRAMTPPEYRVRDEELLSKLPTDECASQEKEFYRPDGSRVRVMLNCAEIVAVPSWRASCFVLDMTDRQRLQDAMAERKRMEMVARLAAGLAHSLNNLLTTMIGNAGLLLEFRNIAESSRTRDLVSEIIATGEKLSSTAGQLLAYSGEGRFVVAPADLCDVIRKEVAQIRPSLPPRITVTEDLGQPLPAVRGDPGQVTCIVHALVANAVEAIPPGREGRVTISARLETIAAGALTSRTGAPLRGGSYCVLEVCDNGVGIEPATLGRIFDPYFSTKLRGRGLGLAAVSGIVNTAGGTIQVTSKPDQGSTFRIYLPPS